MIKWLFKCALLLLAAISVAVLYQQAQLSFLALSRIDPLAQTRLLMAQQRYAEAGEYLGFFMEYDYVQKNPEAQLLHEEIVNKRADWLYQLNKLSEGLLSGTSDETIGQTASVVTDFLVIGDIRDLTKQGVNLAQGEDVDQVLVALATLGLVASAAQIASGAGTIASGGAAAPALVGSTVAKSALIALKTARKLGRLPAWLGKTIVSSAKSAKQSKSLGAMTGVLGDVNTLAKTRGGFKLMQQTKNAGDLRRMAKFADAFSAQSATIYRVGGNLAVDVAQRADTLGKETIKLATTYGRGGLKLLDNVGALTFTKLVSRATKMAYKGDIVQLLSTFLLLLPLWLLYLFISLAAVVWVPWRKLFGKRSSESVPMH